MKPNLWLSAILAAIALASLMVPAASAQSGPGEGVVEAGIAGTTLTYKSHQIAAGASSFNLGGAACPANHQMISGSCHPGYNDGVIIINQFPNRGANAWRCGFENNTGSTRTVWVYTLCAEEGGTNLVTYQLQIRRYTTVPLSNAEADSILSDASTVLQTNDGPGDVACEVALVRSGPVTSFSNGDGSVDSSGEFNTIVGLPGNIKAVSQINWCGALIPNVIGCAPVPGNSLAVVRYSSSLEGILWAHEFGHNKGRSHRTDTTTAVMYPSIGSTHRRVNSSECTSYRASPATAPAVAAMAQEGQDESMDVRDFARQIFIHGVPYAKASQYGAADVLTLLEMLGDPAEEAHWANVVVILGMIGDESAVGPLISFVEEEAADLSDAHYVAKRSVMMSLGYLINKSGNQEALDYLKGSLDPQVWAPRAVGVAPSLASPSERDFDFSKHALLGLTLSAHPEAKEALLAMQQPAVTPGARAFQAQMGDLVSDSLAEFERIASEGLASYYGAREP